MINRIKQVMNYKQMSPASFADCINVNRSSVTHIFTGRNQPSLDVAKKILKAFPEISSDWLIMGTGTMLRGDFSPAISSAGVATTQDSAQQPTKVSGTIQPDLFADFEEVENEIAAPSETPATMSESVNTQPQIVSASEPVDNNNNVEETVRPSKRVRSGETHIQDTPQKRERILKSQEERKLVRVVFFYSDRTCEVYNPS